MCEPGKSLESLTHFESLTHSESPYHFGIYIDANQKQEKDSINMFTFRNIRQPERIQSNFRIQNPQALFIRYVL